MSNNKKLSCKAFRKTSHPTDSSGGQGWQETEVSDTLNIYDISEGRTPMIVVQSIFCIEGNGTRQSHNGNGWKETEIMYTLNSTENHCVAVIENHPSDSRVKMNEEDVVQTLNSRMGTGGGNVPLLIETHPQDSRYRIVGDGKVNQSLLSCVEHDGANGGLVMDTVVRRITPLECERLQGFPDGYTNIGDWTDSKGKLHSGDSDAPRYKALGNSIALPFWEYLAGRMVKELGEENPTMASLFDGIGGFPLVFQRCGCKPVWASEIEEFPIAVTKIHFPEGENQ